MTPPHRRYISAVISEAELTEGDSAKLCSCRDSVSQASSSRSAQTDLSVSFQNLLQTRRTTSQFRSASEALKNNTGAVHQHGESPPLLTSAEYKAALDRAVAAGRAAPNHKRTEPFTFKRLLGPSPSTEKLADIAGHVHLQNQRDKLQGASEDALLAESQRKRDKWIQIPAFLVTLVSSAQPKEGRDEEQLNDNSPYVPLPYIPPATERELEDYAAACAATQNILLSLHAEEISTKWATGPVVRTPAFRELIHAQPSDRVVALIMIGQTATTAAKQQYRRRHRRALYGDVLQDL
jgi:nitroreductase